MSPTDVVVVVAVIFDSPFPNMDTLATWTLINALVPAQISPFPIKDTDMFGVVFHCRNNNEGEVNSHEELVRRRSASVLEVKEHAQDRLKEQLLRAQSVSLVLINKDFWPRCFSW